MNCEYFLCRFKEKNKMSVILNIQYRNYFNMSRYIENKSNKQYSLVKIYNLDEIIVKNLKFGMDAQKCVHIL